MTQKQAIPTSAAPVVQPRRSFRWLDSLMWLAIAGILATLLVPAKSAQTASKQSGRESDATAATAGQSIQSPFESAHGEPPHALPGHEFVLQNEADSLNARNETPAPTSTPAGGHPTESTPDDSPRVTSGPTLNGPELGSPIPR